MAGKKITLSVIKADVGGYVGHSSMHPDLVAKANEMLEAATEKGSLIDFHVTSCGDDLELIMTHQKGVESSEVHKIAWDIFLACTEVAKKLALYGAGQDILKDAFSGNVKGMGPGVAEMEFVERKSDPVIVFMADKTSPGAWNLPVYKMFADPFNTAGLIIDPSMHDGFNFLVLDVKESREIMLSTPNELYDLLALIGSTGRYMIKAVYRRADGEIGASASTQKLSLIAGKYVGKDDPVLIVRCQSGLPAVGEMLEAFAFPHIVEGWMRGSHNGPLMPVSFEDATPTRFDGPPRVIAAGFQLCDGTLVGPVDMFDDPGFDLTRQKANEIAEYMRRHGPFEPHRLPAEVMEYTTLPSLQEKLKNRFKPVK
ncbi:MAG: fructose-1,6-bisphosphate aldolase/phosphatase [Candidatus Eisenbacteria bacterium]|nr:fructose-1,6-bisphosphate aldolase/phosphatase [Candidatus Eisenbacteria bacterium]